MKESLLQLLACPRCLGVLSCLDRELQGEEIRAGRLACSRCGVAYPIVAGIPRFVADDGYGGSFGLQWNLFRTEQLDSATRSAESRRRFYSETGVDKAWLGGKVILEAGCGAGRFLEVAASSGATVIGIDLTRAVEAAALTVADKPNAHVVQASIYHLPFRDGAFDLCYSIGVIQHTPDPARALEALPRVVRRGGRVAVTIYERRPWTVFNAKYLVRPATSRMPHWLLLGLIRLVAPALFPVLDVLYRIPKLGRFFAFIIPFADYSMVSDMGYADRYRAAVLDTFDMLSPRFDQPQTRSEVESALAKAGVNSQERLPTSGLTIIGTRC